MSARRKRLVWVTPFSLSRDDVGNEPFAVMLGDDIIDSAVPCLKQMMHLFEKLQASIIATCEVPHVGDIALRRHSRFSCRGLQWTCLSRPGCRGKTARQLKLLRTGNHRPIHPDSQIFQSLEKTRTGSGGEIQLTDGIRLLLEQQPVYAYMFEGTRYDAGDKLGFLKATVEFALSREDLGTEFRRYLQSLKL